MLRRQLSVILLSYSDKLVELTKNEIDTLIKFAQLGKDDVFYDLGSGTGKVVIRAVQNTKIKKGIGIEQEKNLYYISKKKAQNTLSKKDYETRIDFWYGDFLSKNSRNGYVYDISDATVIYNSLSPSGGRTVFYDSQFNPQVTKIIKKDLPLIGYRPVAVNSKHGNSKFFMMKTPLSKYRISSKSEWAKCVLENDSATIDDVLNYYKSLWLRTNPVKDCIKPIREIKKLIKQYLPDD